MAQTPSPRALFRYHVVSELKARMLLETETETKTETETDAIREVVRLPHWDPGGKSVRLSPRKLTRWLAAYNARGLAGLEPKTRERRSTKLPAELLRFLEEQKATDEEASIPELIDRARIQGVIAEDLHIDRTTVWRACRWLGLPVRRKHRMKVKDMRRFAFSHRMMMVLADGKYFRAGQKRRKRVALHFLDDATRFGLGVVVGTSENTELFLQGLYKVIGKFGMMKVLFLDNGPGFISADTQTTVAQLDIHLIHGTVRHPEGHGKIERFHRTLNERLLRNLDGNPEVDADPEALTLRLNHWLGKVYNHQSHEGLGGLTPAECWRRDSRELDLPKDRTWIDTCFRSSCERLVSADNIVRFLGEAYEVPLGHAGSKVLLTRHLKDGAVSVQHDGHKVILQPVDLQANAYSRRASPKKGESPPKTPARTAGSLHYNADLAPIVDADGSYPKGDQDDES